ncbi:MAG: flagellar biosynthesis protein FlhB [Planctomycetes bacterium]|jgi:flagellar biosynthetic protein FlhB|nr:flagellar biosynthesis protein FlhB [Planctomycetota bacterium]
MAEESAQERTEEPTAERLRKAREEGQFPQSQEVPSAMMIVALLVGLGLSAGMLMDWFIDVTRKGLTIASVSHDFANVLTSAGTSALVISLPLLIMAAAVSVLSSIAVAGLYYSPKAIELKLSRLNPGRGLKEMFSMKSGAQIITALAKIVVLTVLAYHYTVAKMGDYLALRYASPRHCAGQMAVMAMGLLSRVAVAMAIIAAIEYLYQRRSYLKRLRMSRQDIKQERKQYELSPEIKGRIRSIQMAMARRRMLRDVPAADVVIANPTHVAIALKYDARRMQAPVVLARGADLMCQKIKEIARAHDVPVVEKPELARALYAAVDVGQIVPEHLFVAVAEILAMIYRMKKMRKGLLK